MTSPDTKPLLRVEALRKDFVVGGGPFAPPRTIRAVNDLAFSINAGRTLGLVGESGCGKTTVGRLVLNLVEPTSGLVEFDGIDLRRLNTGQMRAMRRDLQIIFQDPLGALNPRMSVGDLIMEPLVIHDVGTRAERQKRLGELLSENGGEKVDHGSGGIVLLRAA